MKKYSKFLPSKQFLLQTAGVLFLAGIVFVIFFMSSKGESFIKNKNDSKLKIENQSVSDLIQNDSDGDGVPDWEEALWGTDKNKKITFNDTPDATYIENKKKELKVEQVEGQGDLTETDKFARDFFTSYSAMKSSGQVDKDTINNFSNALGQKIVNPTLIDSYKESDIKISNSDNIISRQKYYLDIKNLFKQYKKAGIGSELDIVSSGISTNSATGAANKAEQYTKLVAITNAYQNFAKKVMETSVPQSLSEYHLRIANSSNNTGISVLNMAKMIEDPIVGLSGLSQYQKYSDDLIKAVADLETDLTK